MTIPLTSQQQFSQTKSSSVSTFSCKRIRWNQSARMSHWIHLSITLLLHALDSCKGGYLDLYTPHLSLKSSLSWLSVLSLHISFLRFCQNFSPDVLCGHFWGDFFPLLFLVNPLSFFFASCFNFLFSSSINFVSHFFFSCVYSIFFLFFFFWLDFFFFFIPCLVFFICDSSTLCYDSWFVRLFAWFTWWQAKYFCKILRHNVHFS